MGAEFLDSGRTNDAGINVDLINDRDGSDLEDRLDTSLPGASRGPGDMFILRFRQEARTKCVRFSPTGRAWAAASTEGLLIYSLDETATFDPFELSIDLTPQAVLQVLAEQEYLKALVMAFRLNEKPLIQRFYETIPRAGVIFVLLRGNFLYIFPCFSVSSENTLTKTPISNSILYGPIHCLWLMVDQSGEFASIFRVLQKNLTVDIKIVSLTMHPPCSL
jgi:periodic tryptophan protein 2